MWGQGLRGGAWWGGRGQSCPGGWQDTPPPSGEPGWGDSVGTATGQGWGLVLGKWEGDEEQPSLPPSPSGGTQGWLGQGQQPRGNLGQDNVPKKVRRQP